ncbi:hypothetical protein K439DRAFT_1164307 [Ramaria rubella]|nr:hypothetical protein K439DRAFT_1164307 [Ramaria rubella]
MGCLFLFVTVITLLWGVILLITCWRARRVLREANLHGVMCMPTLIRLLILCLYQFVLTIFCGIILAFPSMIPTTFVPVAEGLYPLLVFFLVGLRRDNLQAWFPCWRLEKTESHQAALDFNVNTISEADGSQRSMLRSPLPEKIISQI